MSFPLVCFKTATDATPAANSIRRRLGWLSRNNSGLPQKRSVLKRQTRIQLDITASTARTIRSRFAGLAADRAASSSGSARTTYSSSTCPVLRSYALVADADHHAIKPLQVLDRGAFGCTVVSITTRARS